MIEGELGDFKVTNFENKIYEGNILLDRSNRKSISHHDLIYNPDDYTPLSSYKSVNNVPNEDQYLSIDLQKVFTSNNNIQLLANNLNNIDIHQGNDSTVKKYLSLIPNAQKEFMKFTNINSYEVVGTESRAFNDWVLSLRALNTDFTKYCYKFISWNSFIPSRAMTFVGPSDMRVSKKMTELLAEDIPTIDIHGDYDININNSNYRENNRIPIYRESIHRRNYDRSNDGLMHNNPDEASLETPVRGYNMNDINGLIDKWNKPGWYGLFSSQ